MEWNNDRNKEILRHSYNFFFFFLFFQLLNTSKYLIDVKQKVRAQSLSHMDKRTSIFPRNIPWRGRVWRALSQLSEPAGNQAESGSATSRKRPKTGLALQSWSSETRPTHTSTLPFFQVGRTPCLFFPGSCLPLFLVLLSGSVNELRLRRPREFGRPGMLEGWLTAPEESVDRILQLQ